MEVASGDENFVPGLTANDDVINALKDNTQYEAVITKIDDGMRLIHISLADHQGLSHLIILNGHTKEALMKILDIIKKFQNHRQF